MIRPFKNLEEFKEKTGLGVGDIIITHVVQNWAKSSDNFALKERLITGFDHYTGKVYFGLDWYSLDDLFKTHEYLKDSEWRPFGVEEPEEKKKPAKFKVGKRYRFFYDEGDEVESFITARYKDPLDDRLKVVFDDEICEIHTDQDGNERLYMAFIDDEIKAENEVKE